MRILVTDGNERSALAVTRALGRRGLEVAVGAENKSSLAAASKYCRHSFAYPSPYADEDAFVGRILDIVKRLDIETIFPVSDITMSLVVQHRSEFERHTKLAIPTEEAFESLSNKYRLMQLAEVLGVPIPETVFVPDGRLEDAAGGIRQFPVVVKPARSVVRINGRLCKAGVHYAENLGELKRLYDTVEALREPSLIQRRVNGEGQGVFALMNSGNPLAMFAHRRLREKPPSGGVSVLRESIPLPQPAAEYALRLLKHVGWHGVAMVEFKMERESGVPLLMEVNGRFWGSLQLAIDAGIDFPCLLYRLAAGDKPQAPDNEYRTGIKSRWLLGDIDHLLLRLFKSDRELSLPPDSPTKFQTLIDFCRFYQPGMRNEVLRSDDPRPFVREIRRYLGDLVRPRHDAKIVKRGMRSIKTIARLMMRPTRLLANVAPRVTLKGRDMLTKLPGHVRSILFVCKGNVCRSPLAAAYLDARLKDKGCQIEVRSAGLETTAGKEADPLALAVARQNNLALQAHMTTPLTQDLVARADLILVMEFVHSSTLLQKHPDARGKVFQLGYFNRGLLTEIADPFGGTRTDFDICYDVIRRSCDNLVKYLTARPA